MRNERKETILEFWSDPVTAILAESGSLLPQRSRTLVDIMKQKEQQSRRFRRPAPTCLPLGRFVGDEARRRTAEQRNIKKDKRLKEKEKSKRH